MSDYATLRHCNPMAVREILCSEAVRLPIRYNNNGISSLYFRESDRCFSSSTFRSVQCNYPTVQNSVVCPRGARRNQHRQFIGARSKPIQPGCRIQSQACPNDDSWLQLPAGFCATVFADDIGHARHVVVAPMGVLYVKPGPGRYYANDTPHAGGSRALQEQERCGKADVD